MERHAIATLDGVRRVVEHAEANDPQLRLLKDTVNDAVKKSVDASVKSEDGLVPEDEQRAAIVALRNQLRHARQNG